MAADTITVKITVDMENFKYAQLLLEGKTDLNWSIDGKAQEPLEVSYVQETKPKDLTAFIPGIWRQVQMRREAERFSKMNNSWMPNNSVEAWGIPGKYEETGITYEQFERILEDANRNQIIMPYDRDAAMKFYPLVHDEATMFSEEAVDELMSRIINAYGIQGAQIGEIYDDWRYEYGSQLGWFPNPAAMPASPAVVPIPPAPSKPVEPEFGVVVANRAQVPLSTVNALLSGKFIQEGEQIDTSFKQYVVLFHNDDYNRGEAVQLRHQLRDLIPGVDVVLVPINP